MAAGTLYVRSTCRRRVMAVHPGAVLHEGAIPVAGIPAAAPVQPAHVRCPGMDCVPHAAACPARLRHGSTAPPSTCRALARLRDHLEAEDKDKEERGGGGGGADADAEIVEAVEAAGGAAGAGGEDAGACSGDGGGESQPVARGAWGGLGAGEGQGQGQGEEGADGEQGAKGGAWEDETEALGTVIAPPPPLAAY